MYGLLFTPPRRNARPMRHRILSWPVALAIVVALHVVSVLFLLRLSFNNAPDVYYTPGSPAFVLRESLRQSFPDDEVLVVLLQGDDLYTVSFLRKLDDFVRRVERDPLTDRVSAITSMEHIGATRDGFAVGPLIDAAKLSNEKPEDLRRRVMNDRFAPGMLASRDGRHLAVIVRPKRLTESTQRVAVKLAVSEAAIAAGIAGYFVGDAGPVAMDVAQLQSILGDSAVFVPVTVALALGLMGWLVRRVRAVVIGALAMTTVIAPTIAAIVAAGQPYTMATAILPSLLAAYTAATLMHFYAAILHGHASGLSRGRSIDQALQATLKPGIFNALTTGAGLLSLLFVPIPPIQVFGAAGALGTMLVFFTVYFLVPPFLRHWDNRRWPKQGSGLGRFGSLARRLALFSLRHPKRVVVTALIAVAVGIPLATRVQVEADILAFFQPEHPLRQVTSLVEEKLSGVTSLEISVVGTGPDSLQDIATLQHVRRLQRWLEQQPGIDRTLSIADLVEEMHWAMNGEKPAARTLPPTNRLLRQYLLVYDGRDLHELVDRDFQRGRILVSMHFHGAQRIGDAIEKIRDHLRQEPLPGLVVEVGGYGRLFSDQSEMLISGQISSFVSAFGQIFLFMLLLWRSLSAAALCMVPNLAPLFFVFVVMGTLGIHIDNATVMIASVVLGITVDDTIHIYHHYRERLRDGASPVWAIARSFESTGPAVMAISVLLVSQFGLLAMSNFIPTANFGLMTAVGLLSGQVFELLLLPALLLLKDGRKPRATPAADSNAGSPSTIGSDGPG